MDSMLPHLRIPKLEHTFSQSMELGLQEAAMVSRKRKMSDTAPAAATELGPPVSYVAMSSVEIGASFELPVRSCIIGAQNLSTVVMPPPHADNPLDEPSPLGLRLKKTPSLLDLISMKLTQGLGSSEATVAHMDGTSAGLSKNRLGRCLAPTGSAHDKLKASNFPASRLRIGSWERLSRYEGDLVAKCYYAKRKLVWEVLENGLKSKIEIQWSDISDMKASCPDCLPGSLEIEVSRPPLFFRETNPQPRKHTLWQATSDFTGGEATVCMKHELQFPEGILNRHYEKLVQCDPRLKSLVSGTLATRVSARYEPSTAAYDVPQKLNGPPVMDGHEPISFSEGLVEQPDKQPETILDRMLVNCRILAPKPEYDLRLLDMESSELASPSSVIDGRDESCASDTEELHVREDLGGRSCAAPPNYSCGGGDMWDHECFPLGWTTGQDTRSSDRKVLDELRYMLLGEPSATALTDQQALLFAATVGSMTAAYAEEAKDIQTAGSQNMLVDGLPSQMFFTNTEACEGAFEQAYDELASLVPLARDTTSRGVTNSANHNLYNSSVNSFYSSSAKHGSTGDLLLHLPRVASLPQFIDAVSQVPVTRQEVFYQQGRKLGWNNL